LPNFYVIDANEHLITLFNIVQH